MTTVAVPCFHCGLPVPPGSHYQLQLDDAEQSFCCPGCQAVASAIAAGGLTQFYRYRDTANSKPVDTPSDFSVYDLVDVQQDFVDEVGPGQREAQLLLGGISCAACVWLIEQHLGKMAGVISVRVNATTHRCLVRWDTSITQLSTIMQSLARVGYQPMPALEHLRQQQRQKEGRTALMRLGVAGFGMMQVGMVAVMFYVGGAEPGWESYFRWVSLLMTLPVVLYSALPFYQAAWRSLKTFHLTMDVPVSLAIIWASLASAWATLFGGGEVYYDSVTMFTFLLLSGRYLEMRARHRNGIDADRLAQLLPVTAEVSKDGDWVSVPLKQVVVGDRLLVAAGTTIPCDGVVVAGQSGVVEVLLTGEPDAIEKRVGDDVIAGTMNTDSALQIDVTATGKGTRLSAIERLVEQAQQSKPKQVAMADRLAGYFVGAVLLVSAAVGGFWWYHQPENAFWIVLSVLVVTCPCALSLAAPTALTTAVSWLRRHGLLVTGAHVLEALPQVTRIVFDKTGTLTVGEPQVQVLLDAQGQPLPEGSTPQWLAIAAALETGSRHPIAKAFAPYQQPLQVENVRQVVGQGVTGEIAGASYFLGKSTTVSARIESGDIVRPESDGQWLVLLQGDAFICWIGLRDCVRDTAQEAVRQLAAKGIAIELLSGDDEPEVARVARELNIDEWHSDYSPQQKLARVESLQSAGERVLMVGDGINDVPVLSAAFVSVAMGGATDLAQTKADSVLLGSDLQVLLRSMQCARVTQSIIRQNLMWALLYNAVALPAAAMGLVPPWLAAAGMSGSSLIVVANALRIGRLS